MSILNNTGILAGASGAGGDSGYKIKKSLRLNNDDSAHLTRTPSSAGNRKTWTFSCWFKRGNLATAGNLFSAYGGGGSYSASNFMQIYVTADDKIRIWGDADYFHADTLLRDPSAWYSLVVVCDTTLSTSDDRLKVYLNNERLTKVSGTVSPQNVDLAINNNIAAYIGTGTGSSEFFDGLISEYYFIDGQALTPSDFGEVNEDTGVWDPKEYTGTYGTNGFYLKFNGTDLGEDSSGNDNDWTANNLSTFEGNGNWISQVTGTNYSTTYGIPQMFDNNSGSECLLTVGTSGNWTIPGGLAFTTFAIKSYDGDGGTITFNWSGGSYDYTLPTSAPASPVDISANLTSPLTSVTWDTPTIQGPYIREVVVDGVRLVDNSYTDTDSLTDTPTNYGSDSGLGGEVRGNYCTLNPIGGKGDLSTGTFSQGNLTFATSTTAQAGKEGTIAVKSGKFYWEVTLDAVTGGQTAVGVAIPVYAASRGDESMCYRESGQWYVDTTTVGTKQYNAATYTTGDTIGFALDMDNNKLFISKNGTWQGSSDPAAGTNPAVLLNADILLTPYLADYFSGNTYTFNFGARPFANAAPSGFKCLCTQNLPDPTIEDPSKHFGTKLWSGDTASGTVGDRSLTGLNFSPDFLWVKQRNQAYSAGHQLYDIVRGLGPEKELDSSAAREEGGSNPETYGYINSFDSDGFTTRNGTSGNTYVNATGNEYVAWAWNAGTANTSVSAGDLNSSVYNNSDMWSDDFDGNVDSSYPAERAFDITTANTVYATAGSTATWTPAGTITGVNTLEVRAYANQAGSNHSKLKVNGTDYTSLFGSDYTVWKTIPMSGTTLTSLSMGGDDGTHYVGLTSIRINGKELVDSNVTLINVPSIASTYRANPSAGFSIVSYTGNTSASTVAHGLNSEPKMIIVKDRDSGSWNWHINHASLAADESLIFYASAAADYNAWNDTRPTSTVFSLGGNISGVSADGHEHIAYIWSEVEAYSKFGSYESTAFVYTGFQPAFLMIKNADNGGSWSSWWMGDNKRSTHNLTGADNTLWANLNVAEGKRGDGSSTSSLDSIGIDLLSNGFKVLVSGPTEIGDTDKYIYAAFAEHPFKHSRAR